MESRLFMWLIMTMVLVGQVGSPGLIHSTSQYDGLSADPVQIRAVLRTEGPVSFIADLTFHNTGPDEVEVLPIRIDSLRVSLSTVDVGDVTAHSTVTTYSRYTEILVSLSDRLQPGTSAKVHLEFSTDDLQSTPRIGPDAAHYLSEFVYYVRPACTFSNFTLYVHLPISATLSESSAVPVFPVPTGNYTDGKILVFYWTYDEILIGQERVFMVKYQYPLDSSGDLVVSGLIWMMLLLGFVMGALTMRYGPVVVRSLRRVGRTRYVGVTSEEQEILDIIRSRGGSCPQKELYQESNMSQARVSVILNNLEERNLVKRFREGRENIVYLMEQ
ncbi:MAG: MarR family transcriptional regulator [Candidatus Thorarchaeota archaeon]